PGRTGGTDLGALGRQPGGALGVMHPLQRQRAHLRPGSGYAVMGDRLRPAARIGPPDRAGARSGVLGPVGELSAYRACARLPAGCHPRAARVRATASPDELALDHREVSLGALARPGSWAHWHDRVG